MNALICWGENSLPSARKRQEPSPMWRFTDRIVRSGLVTACRLATSPTSTSPVLEKATTEGVVREPSALGMTVGSPPSITATTEFVVPRSIPTALAISSPRTCCGRWHGRLVPPFEAQDRDLSVPLSTYLHCRIYLVSDQRFQLAGGSRLASSGSTRPPGPTPAAANPPAGSSTA